MDALHRRGMIPPPPPLGFVDQYPIYMVQPLVNTDFAISQDWPVNEPHDEHTHEEPGDDHWVLTDEALSFFKESAARRKNRKKKKQKETEKIQEQELRIKLDNMELEDNSYSIYGDHQHKIKELESMLDAHYDSMYDKHKPIPWPTVPLRSIY
eukprot:TRINITY_DN1718_c0_g1_i1.p1 TRINITY_DN1718_c0_g1~~TRINITY_DN1718_c0_g1_i1.p1  ORF type:complete len:153 (-),score=37.46 TRINITY_DN1718_c0_g1_i1:44-502(-)